MIEATATIDLTALQYNFSQVKKLAPRSKVIAMIKSNAYGHGLIHIAKTLQAADAFGVARLTAALHLREAGIQKPIVLMQGFLNAEQLPIISQYRFQIVVHYPEQVALLLKLQLEKPLDIWLKVDTGMGRLGFTLEQAQQQYQCLRDSKNIDTIRFMTHFASVDELQHENNTKQFSRLTTAKESLPGEWSAAKSAAIIAFPDTHNEWVRPGIMLYGVSPIIEANNLDIDLKPVMTLTAPVVSVRTLAKGEAVGYGSTWICPEEMSIAVVGIGYGDGYPRHAIAGTPVLLKGKYLPRIGRVCMDMIMVDLRGIDERVKIGDMVTLWGQNIPAEMIAAYAETVAYELFCGVTRRVKFVYQ